MNMHASACLAVAAALLMSGSASGQPAAAKPAGPSCFWVRDVNNFAAVDDKNLYVRVGVNEVYRLKLFGNCLDLDWVHHIGLRTRSTSNICEGRNPDLDVFDREIGIGRQICPVIDVTKLTSDEVKALPKDARP